MTFDALPVPTTESPSSTCTSKGDAMVIQPASGDDAFGSENTTAVVAPASTVTVRSDDPVSLLTATLCSDGDTPVSVNGVVPRIWPSRWTRAPLGSVTME